MKEPQKIKIRRSSAFPYPYPVLPVLLYRGVIKKYMHKKADQFEQLFYRNNWRGVWRDTIYKFRHFHSNAHEALGIARGFINIELGGIPGKKLLLKAGDLLILPAGTVHHRLAASTNLIVVGAYPQGQQKYNMCHNLENCHKAQQKINHLSLPKTDPIFGKSGPLVQIWSR